jgi:hypothetical protein
LAAFGSIEEIDHRPNSKGSAEENESDCRHWFDPAHRHLFNLNAMFRRNFSRKVEILRVNNDDCAGLCLVSHVGLLR